MPYDTPFINSDRGQYQGTAEVEADQINFAGITLQFSLVSSTITNEGNLDEVFESLLTHIAAHPAVLSATGNKLWSSTQVVTPIEEEVTA